MAEQKPIRTVSWDMIDVKNQFHKYDQTIADMASEIGKLKKAHSSLYEDYLRLTTAFLKLDKRMEKVEKECSFEKWEHTQHEVY